MQSLEIKVQNVKCGGCASNIRQGLLALQGVQDVQVNITTGLVSLKGGSLEHETIRQTLAQLGYPPV